MKRDDIWTKLLKLVRWFFPKRPPHFRIAMALITLGGLAMVGPPMWLVMVVQICAEQASPAMLYCESLKHAVETPFWIGFITILLGVFVFLFGPRFDGIPRDDWLSFNGEGMTFEEGCKLIEREKNVPIQIIGLNETERSTPLKSLSIEGKNTREVLKDLLKKVDGETFPNCEVWETESVYEIGRILA